jgi:hypothetical protein
MAFPYLIKGKSGLVRHGFIILQNDPIRSEEAQ